MLSIGTAQFGSKYGILNNRGKVPYKEVEKILKHANKHGITSLDTAYNEYSILFASKDDNPESSLQNKELKTQIKEALGVLNQREALVAQLYYVEELNVYEIAEVLEISTGRISQIKKSIIGKLRNEINPD